MSHESGASIFSAPSPSDVDVQDPITTTKRAKISYTREFLLSLYKVDSTVKLQLEAPPLLPCVVDQSPGLLSPPPLCAPDFICQKSVPQNFSLKVVDDVSQLLHRSDEPYRPPCRHKAGTSTRDGNYLLNGDTSGPTECTSQERADRETWRKDTLGVAKEDKWHSSKNADSKDSPDELLISPARRKSNGLQFASSIISKQLDASQKSSQIQGAAEGDAGLPATMLETATNFPTPCHQVQDLTTNGTVKPCHQVQDLTTNGTVKPWLKTVNHLDKGVHLMDSEECTNLDVEDLQGISHVMESLKKSMGPSFLSKENCGNHKKNQFEVAHEQHFMESQSSNTPVSVYDSPKRISTSDPSEAYISPTSVEKEKQLVSMINDCESSTVYCKGISARMKQNPSCPDIQIHREFESESFSCSFDGESNSSFELCLPDEDSLITFDELFLMPDMENLAVFDSSMTGIPQSNLIEADVFSPSSPREMVEKLVEFILNDESSTPHVDGPIVHHEAGLGCFPHSMHAQQTSTKFCSNQLNEEKDPQDQNKFQRISHDSAIYSFITHSFPSNTFSQALPLYHDELKRFDHEVSQSMPQQIINRGKLHLCSLTEVPPHLPALQTASSTQKMQTRPFAYQEPKNYGDLVRPSPDFQGDSNINPALVDKMNLLANHWHPPMQGF